MIPDALVGKPVVGTIQLVPLCCSHVPGVNQLPVLRLLQLPLADGTGMVGGVGSAQPPVFESVMTSSAGGLLLHGPFAVTLRVAVGAI